MIDRIYVITDLGPGDGGKGGIVHFLANRTKASVVIKRGGAQGSHGVRTSKGDSFNFSQWGCGTFDGVPTYCSEQMILSPIGLDNESNALKRNGFYDPYTLLSAAPNCVCTTPLHQISSQFEEILRKDNPRGTIGTGVGRAARMHNEFGDDMTIYASELTDRERVMIKLNRQAEYYRERYAEMSKDDYLEKDSHIVIGNLNLLHDDEFLLYIANSFETVGKKLQLKELSDILKLDGTTAIVECSHGMLTDAKVGLKPHVSAIRTLPRFTCNMLRDSGYKGEIYNFGVHRAYEIRHGAGPLPTYDPIFTSDMLPDSHKQTNRWQGEVRAGALDMELLKHVVNLDDETHFDGICITWFDQIKTNGTWQICTKYKNSPDPNESYTNFLKRAIPVMTSYRVKSLFSSLDLFHLVDDAIQEFTGIPVSILSKGSTEMDKLTPFPNIYTYRR